MVKKYRLSFMIGVMMGCGLWGGLAPEAQAQTATVRGFVTDAANGEALQGVNVVVENTEGVLYGAATDSDGLYVVAGLQPGRYLMRVSFVGFYTYRDTLQLAPREVQSIDVALEESEEELDTIVVEAEQEGQAANLTGGLQTIQPFDIEQVPSPDLAGDFASYLTTLPGVVVIGDQGGQFYIRGGEPSQNLVLLDGMLVYQPFHVLSFFSAFPSDILNSVDLYAGGFGARFGGRISSVIDASTRNGNNQRFVGSASVSPFIVAGRVEGPLDENGRISLLASGRHSVVEEGAARLVARDVPFRFNDLFVKLHGIVNRNSRLSVSALQTYDRGTVGEDTGSPLNEVRWSNHAVGGRYLFLPGNMPILAEFMVSYSRFNNELGESVRPIRTSTTDRISSEVNITHFTTVANIRWGLFARTLEMRSELGGLYQELRFAREFVTEAGGYVAPEFKLGEEMVLTPSVRIHNFPSKQQVYVEPRFRAVWTKGKHQISGAAGLFHQEIVGLSDRRDATSAFTAWAAVPLGEVPQAFHMLLGYQRRLANGLEFVAEGYYKKLFNLYIAEWTAFPRLTTRLQQADGRVAGLDLRLELRRPHFYGYINYGLSSVEYEAKQESLELWFGTETFRFRPAHDRRHQINALASTRLLGFDLSARWQFGSGLPFNRALGFDGFLLMDGTANVFRDEGDRRVIYERPFNGILPTYHRLDLSLERVFTTGRARTTVQASLINAYDRANIFFLDVFTLQRADQLPLIPSFGIKVELD